MKEGRIYFVCTADRALVKIGFSIDVSARFLDLAKHSPVPILLLTSAPGTQRLERAIHYAFREQHHHFEWFTASREIFALADFVGKTGVLPPYKDAPNRWCLPGQKLRGGDNRKRGRKQRSTA